MDILQSAVYEGLTPAIIVAIYLIIVKFIDSKKEKNQIKITNDLINAINKISSFLDNITENIINKDKEKCRVAIRNSFQAFKLIVIEYVANTIVRNNIEVNRENIMENVRHLINSEYYKTCNDLSMYIIDGLRVNDIMKQEWINEVIEDTINSIYNHNLEKEQRIFTFVSKISIRFDDYVVYINNKVFK